MHSYYLKRLRWGQLRYRLERRTREVRRAMREYSLQPLGMLLDIGTADGLMLENLSLEQTALIVGVDLSFELLRANPNRSFCPVQADGISLPFPSGVFDVVIATAVIEHVSDALAFLTECCRVLRQSGLCVLTTPDPFFEKIYAMFDPSAEKEHHETFSLKDLGLLMTNSGFEIVEAEKFMMSPIGLPLETLIEGMLHVFRLGFLLLNQVIVGRKA